MNHVLRSSVDELLQEASHHAGLSDWGDELSFKTGLGVLREALLRESAAVQAVGHGQIQQLLTTRLRLVADAQREPAIVHQDIVRPMVITGLPRSGTTFLHELLALDPAARAPRQWEGLLPSPPPDAASFETDPRIATTQAFLDQLFAAAPLIAAIHPVTAVSPTECNHFTTLHFASQDFTSGFHVPAYARWLEEVRPEGVFRTHRRVLQQLQWKGPRGRWTLKSPPHLFDLEGLLAAYPDACIVQTHREPIKTMTSLASMVCAQRRVLYPDTDPAAVGAAGVQAWSVAAERSTAARASPTVDAHCHDVAQAQLGVDPIGVVRRIYERFSLEFSSAYQTRLDGFVRQHAHGAAVHRYTAQEFGLDAGKVARRFDAYRSAYAKYLSE